MSTQPVEQEIHRNRVDYKGAAFKAILVIGVSVSVLILLTLIINVVTGGLGVLTTRPVDFLTGNLRSSADTSGLGQAIRGTMVIAIFVLLFAIPIGIGSAIYLEEYARDGAISRFIELNVRNLAGVPSVVYGILGLAIFVRTLGSVTGPGATNGRSLISGGLTIAVLVLPLVIITAAEAIRAVPQGLRDSGMAMGATRWEMIRTLVLPSAAPGILTGTVLALTRAMGEAAPLILVGATTGFLTGGSSFSPGSFTERFTALPVVIAEWSSRPQEGFQDRLAPAAIVVLIALVVALNAAAVLIRNRVERRLAR